MLADLTYMLIGVGLRSPGVFAPGVGAGAPGVGVGPPSVVLGPLAVALARWLGWLVLSENGFLTSSIWWIKLTLVFKL